jgi:transcriptional regulator with XRE-family HTH domain
MSAKPPKIPDFAALLKDWRERKGLTQQQAAEVLGISFDSIRNWEIRRYVPNTTVRGLLLARLQQDLGKG